MNEKINDEPAFPRTYNGDGHNGMSLRDYFAAKAMQTILANGWLSDESANDCYDIAAAMLKAREERS